MMISTRLPCLSLRLARTAARSTARQLLQPSVALITTSSPRLFTTTAASGGALVKDALDRWVTIKKRLAGERQESDPPTTDDMAALSQAVVVVGKCNAFWGLGVRGDAEAAKARHDDNGHLLLFTSELRATAFLMSEGANAGSDADVAISLPRDTIRGAFEPGKQFMPSMGVCINGEEDMTFPGEVMLRCYELADAN